PSAPHGLRTLERIARASGTLPLLGNVLVQQADAYDADAPKLGALHGAVALVEHRLTGDGDASDFVGRILKRAPHDRAALDATVRAELATAPEERAAWLTQAAGQLMTAEDTRLGARPERLARAAQLLERALDASPEAIGAAGLLVAVRTEDGARDRLLATIRA